MIWEHHPEEHRVLHLFELVFWVHPGDFMARICWDKNLCQTKNLSQIEVLHATCTLEMVQLLDSFDWTSIQSIGYIFLTHSHLL